MVNRNKHWAVAGFALFFCACSPVKPWERGTLAKPHMALDLYPTQDAYRSHVHGSREAAGGGSGSHGGGGCGCY